MLILLSLACGPDAIADEPDEVIPAAYVESVQCGPEHLDRTLNLGTSTPFALQVWTCDDGCSSLHTRWTVEGDELTISCAAELRYEARWLIVGS